MLLSCALGLTYRLPVYMVTIVVVDSWFEYEKRDRLGHYKVELTRRKFPRDDGPDSGLSLLT